MLDLSRAVMRMKRLPRTGWLLAGVTQPESVAEHSYGTAILACFLAETVNSGDNSRSEIAEAGRPLDVGRVARIALVHDLSEYLVTDLPRQTSELIGRDVKHAAEREAINLLLTDVTNGTDYIVLWKEYESGSTAEARIVRDADRLDMVIQAYEYELAGNSNMDEFWDGHSWNYPASKQLYDRILAERIKLLAKHAVKSVSLDKKET